MLEDYSKSQKIVYRILKNSINRDELSHAYLFETSGYKDASLFVMAFIKTILCPQKKTKKENCGKCHQCEVIESGNYPEIKIINPDGMWIKKNQLKQLQSEFKEKALIGNIRIYVINEADKLNQSAANSILKFIEEPEEGIIAILVTDNIYNILETIRSRCQILKFKQTDITEKYTNTIDKIKQIIYKNRNNKDELIKSEKTDTTIEKMIYFINYYEKNHLNTLLYIGKLFHEYVKTKEELIDALDIISLYYKDIINIKIGLKPEIFRYNKEIEIIEKNNNINNLCKKLKIIISAKQKVKYNTNINLLIDKLIIDLDGGI